MEMHLAKVLKVYQVHLWYWKESDQRRRSNTLQRKRSVDKDTKDQEE
jgi:hypothetical protein